MYVTLLFLYNMKERKFLTYVETITIKMAYTFLYAQFWEFERLFISFLIILSFPLMQAVNSIICCKSCFLSCAFCR